MIFYSPTFLIFFLIFLAGLPFVGRGSLLKWYVLLSSWIFYAWWNPFYLPVLIVLSLLGYGGGLIVARHQGWTPAVIALLLLPLIGFKYAGFIVANIEEVFAIDIPFQPDWSLPLGVSFITFTVISYVVDIKRQALAPERTFGRVGLFAAFFPHLVAGPILRGRELLPQLRAIHISTAMVPFGLLLFSIGAAKKVILADGVAPWVDTIYASTTPLTAGQSLLAFYGFAVQIYADFSGYTDMALGLAAIIGVRLPRNFERPYLAASVREFWHRWHMTLSRWLRDYVYIPMGGNRRGYGRMLLALMATMLIGGLWHGASWAFVIWGGLHGAALVLEQLQRRYWPTMPTIPLFLRRLFVFHFVAFAWILFRARDLAHFEKIVDGLWIAPEWSAYASAVAWPACLILVALLVHPIDSVSRVRWLARAMPKPVVVTLAIVTMVLCAALSIGNPGTFIYFDF
ncbi:MAG: MBOAT family protein [Alphaproteobacteria bacterium]|nr:MBOAT family protein [Alphaproteobacteria bacterium]